MLEAATDMPGDFVVFQPPNPPLAIALAAGAGARLTHGRVSHDLAVLSQGALLIWAVEEIVSGVNWLRRTMGAAGAAYSLASLARSLKP